MLDVAHDLLGRRLVRLLDGQRISGLIVETEAYRGEEDLACHARAGRTPRTAVMYGPPGQAYVYFTYGMHWLLNCVTGPEGFPAAVLIRAILPQEGLEVIAARRAGRPRRAWCNGPAKLCQALSIDGSHNDSPLWDSTGALWLEKGQPITEEQIKYTPRIGIDRVPEPWRSIPWRFVMNGTLNEQG
ncbi:MAG: DNA-3-methyladenine glycosylase [Anaerolineaceae bacterium]|nr:DNA-3-methyladenine glycosylase [Anaerolineaceae bacterium]